MGFYDWKDEYSCRIKGFDNQHQIILDLITKLHQEIFGRFSNERRNRETVEHAMLEWVHWFNTKRLLEPIANIPPCEFEKLYYDEQDGLAMGAGLN